MIYVAESLVAGMSDDSAAYLAPVQATHAMRGLCIFVLFISPQKGVSLHPSATDVRPVEVPICWTPFLGIDRENLLHRRLLRVFVDRWAQRRSLLAIREHPAG